MIKLTTQKEFNDFIKNNDVCCAKFGADWCGPCKTLNRMLDEIEKTDISYKIAECDIDDDEILNIAHEIGVRNIPFICFYKNGELKDVHQGVITALELNNKVNSLE